MQLLPAIDRFYAVILCVSLTQAQLCVWILTY